MTDERNHSDASDTSRRETFARKLKRSSHPPPPPPAPAVAAGPPRPAEDYVFMGRFEEAQQHWAKAAEHFARAFEAQPDPVTAAHAADDMRRGHLDLHRAARYAEYAVAAQPERAEFRVVLGLVYRDAGLMLRARSELERAVRLEPQSDRAKRLLVAMDRAR